MQPREKILATVAAIVFAFVVLRPDHMILAPLRDRDSTIKSTLDIVNALEIKESMLIRAQAALADYRARSLPPSAADAQREYSEWLTDLALLSNWQNPLVTLGPKTPRGPATMVPITIKAKATLEDVNQFLLRFTATSLFHRVSVLELTSPGFEGNPLLDVELTAEGAAVTDATPRTRLFPTAELAAALDNDDRALTPDNVGLFPTTAPFRVRLDRELIQVDAVTDGRWDVARGAFDTHPAEHALRTPIELWPTQVAVDSPLALPAVQRLFVQAPDVGTLQLTAELTPAVRGRAWNSPLTVQNWDPALGRPQLRLATGAPAGMTLDQAENKLVWTPPEDFPLGPIKVHVEALGRNDPIPVVESDLAVEVRRPNNSPKLTIPDQLDVWLGQPWRYELSADDADLPNDSLTYALGGNVPPGLTIDGGSGVLNWSPPAEMDLSTFDVEITVSDSGQPPETDRRTLTLQLADDNALYTYFSGTIAVNGAWEAWLYDRSTNQLTIVRAGDEFQIADVSGKAVRVDENAMDIESNGQTYRLQLGQNLRDWTPVAAATRAVNPDEDEGSGENSGS